MFNQATYLLLLSHYSTSPRANLRLKSPSLSSPLLLTMRGKLNTNPILPSFRPSFLPSFLPSHPPKQTPHRAGVTGAEVLALVRHRYSTIRRFVLKPAPPPPATGRSGAGGADLTPATVLVEVHFAGPQPSAGCGELLCLLLGGDSVRAQPVELPRGRKRKKLPEPGTHAVCFSSSCSPIMVGVSNSGSVYTWRSFAG